MEPSIPPQKGPPQMVKKHPELLEATDEMIADAMEYANPMTLRGLLYQLTGDEDIARVRLRTVDFRDREMQAVADPADVALIRSKAAKLLRGLRDAGPGDVEVGPMDRLHRSLELAVGVEIPSCDLPLWVEQLAVNPWARGLEWRSEPPEGRLEEFLVVVIGAGMGGLNAAVQLQHAGIPFTVLEKNGAVGGTWYENRYPGARVDSPSRNYSHIFGVGYTFPYPFSPQTENEKYFNWVADTFDLRKHIEFHTEVISILWDDQAKVWEVTADQPDGRRVWRANVVISAVGFLARPNVPEIEGVGDFAGPVFHTARWPKDLDLTGRKVAVIGSGCTGYQMVPELCKVTEHTYLFQRTPNWVFDVPGYLAPFPPQVTWLDRNFPFFSNFYRFTTCWVSHPESATERFRADPDYEDEHAVSATNKRIRDHRLEFMRAKFAGRPDLIEKMLPIAPPMSGRPVLVDAEYSVYDALLRDDVTLVDDPIRRVTTDGIETESGALHRVDAIVLATGFKANDFLWPMEIRGRDGARTEELWAKDGARAYLGTMLPGFPNLFILYGPNTNQVGGLQIVDMEEMVTRFALHCISGLVTTNKRAVDVTIDAYWRYNAVVDRAESSRTYLDPRAHNYYRNEHGRSATNGPLDTRLMWHWLRQPVMPTSEEPRPDVVEKLHEASEAVRPHFGADLVVE
jgi:4-hydroxyacetophenone monooxygenase